MQNTIENEKLTPHIGVKLIYAKPEQRDGKDGYAVYYHPDMYKSWSPKEVFEAAYFPLQLDYKISPPDVEVFMALSEEAVSTIGAKTTLVSHVIPTGWEEHATFLLKRMMRL